MPKTKTPTLTISADARMTKEGPLAVIAVTGFESEDAARAFAKDAGALLLAALKKTDGQE